MPLYEYVENGHIIERVVPVAERDRYPGRLTAPRRIAVCPRGAPSQEQETMRGFQQVEQKIGTSALRKGFPFSLAHTRKVWGKNRATDNF